MKVNIIEVLDANITTLRDRFGTVDEVSCNEDKSPCGHVLHELKDIHDQCHRQAVLVEELLPKFKQEEYLKSLGEITEAVAEKHQAVAAELLKHGPPGSLMDLLSRIFGPPVPMGPVGDA